MNLLEVEHVIGERLGLDLAALGPAVSPRSIENRMRANRAQSERDYLELLVSQPRELEALAAELVVSETWFFRGGFPLFQRLAQFLATRAGARAAGSPVRVLSVPCSTGEEPYSLAIAVREIGLPTERCTIDAVDLSQTHIDRAVAAVYSSFAFREPGPDIRPLYFRQVGAHWTPLAQVRQCIHFRTGNIIAPSFLTDEAPYDLIICRNLFIYLNAEGRRRAIAALDRLLALDGILCVTPAEADRLASEHFVPEGPIEFGLYRRGDRAAPPLRKPIAQRLANWEPPPLHPPLAPQSLAQEIPPPRLLEVRQQSPLSAAQELADAGRLAEARSACEQLVRTQTALPDAYTLLGVIHQAEGRHAEAGDAFRKALYLAPNHPEALTHMIVWCESEGDAVRADALRRHLQRLTAEGKA
jgi:chemotaxis protein methyltransferase WspC